MTLAELNSGFPSPLELSSPEGIKPAYDTDTVKNAMRYQPAAYQPLVVEKDLPDKITIEKYIPSSVSGNLFELPIFEVDYSNIPNNENAQKYATVVITSIDQDMGDDTNADPSQYNKA